MGEPFVERTVSTSLTLARMRYPSRHDYGVARGLLASRSDLSVEPAPGGARASAVSPTRPEFAGTEQVGVEHGKSWECLGIVTPPQDWMVPEQQARREPNLEPQWRLLSKMHRRDCGSQRATSE